jgi:hypothetical protein
MVGMSTFYINECHGGMNVLTPNVQEISMCLHAMKGSKQGTYVGHFSY